MPTTKKTQPCADFDTHDTYWRENFSSRPYATEGARYEDYRPAYECAVVCQAKHPNESFADVETKIRRQWEKMRSGSACKLNWEQARPAMEDAWNHTIQLREEELRIEKEPVETGEVQVRKEVVHEKKTVEVPVEREEVVIERRPVRRRGTEPVGKAEEIRIPVREEKVRVTKEPVVKEEVAVRKRKVADTRKVSDTVRKERVKVDNKSTAKVKDERVAARNRK